jgi:hypothetical protein
MKKRLLNALLEGLLPKEGKRTVLRANAVGKLVAPSFAPLAFHVEDNLPERIVPRNGVLHSWASHRMIRAMYAKCSARIQTKCNNNPNHIGQQQADVKFQPACFTFTVAKGKAVALPKSAINMPITLYHFPFICHKGPQGAEPTGVRVGTFSLVAMG